MPVLVIYGEKDALVGPRHSRELLDYLPHAVDFPVKDAGHMLNAERAVEYTEALDVFWSRH